MSEIEGAAITVTLNGEAREIPAGLSVRGLLEHLRLNERLVVVERNREILRRGDYGEVRVKAGDVLELIHFVGGG
jgi:thiamine biosynthesis protein ThiS